MKGQASLNMDKTISLNVTMNTKEARVFRDLMQNPNEKASDMERNIQEFIFLVMKAAIDMDYKKVFVVDNKATNLRRDSMQDQSVMRNVSCRDIDQF